MTLKARVLIAALGLVLSWSATAQAEHHQDSERGDGAELAEGDSAGDDDSAADRVAGPSIEELAETLHAIDARLDRVEADSGGLSVPLASGALGLSLVALVLAVIGLVSARRPATQPEPSPPGRGLRGRSERDVEVAEAKVAPNKPPGFDIETDAPGPPRAPSSVAPEGIPQSRARRQRFQPPRASGSALPPAAAPPRIGRTESPSEMAPQLDERPAGPPFRPKRSALEPPLRSSRIAPNAMDESPPRPRVSNQRASDRLQPPTPRRSPPPQPLPDGFQPLIDADPGSGASVLGSPWRDEPQEPREGLTGREAARPRRPERLAIPVQAPRPASSGVDQEVAPASGPAESAARTPIEEPADCPETGGSLQDDGVELHDLTDLFQQLPHGEIGILLVGLQRQAPSLAERFSSETTREEFLDELDELLEHRLQRFLQVCADEEDVYERWVEPDLLHLLNTLAHFQSLAEQEVRAGTSRDRGLSDELFRWLYERLGVRCSDEEWFGLDPVRPWVTEFDPGRHHALGGREAPGAERKVVAVEQVGRVHPRSGRLTTKAQVVVGK